MSRGYSGDTNVLQTEFRTAGGVLHLTDFMPMGEENSSAVVRRLEVREGEVEVEVSIAIRFGYGDISPWFSALSGPGGDGFSGEVGPDLVVLRGPGLSRDEDVLRARITLSAGERADYVLQYGPSELPILDSVDRNRRSDRPWRLGGTGSPFDRKTDWPEAVKRSLLTLKALTYAPTGGIVAAPTLGLPEKPGGSMNWDYRYCWLRDSTFTLTALLNAGFHEEAQAWLRWLLRAVGGAPDKMRVMYRVDGGRQIEEREIDHLPGWNGGRPVRVGNAASDQRQLDVYGEVLDSIRLCRRAGLPSNSSARTIGARLVAHVQRIWREPDQGLWEFRAKPQHYVYSKVMAWVAVDRCWASVHARTIATRSLRLCATPSMRTFASRASTRGETASSRLTSPTASTPARSFFPLSAFCQRPTSGLQARSPRSSRD